MSNAPNYEKFHLHELETALKNLDCEANPEEEKLLKKLIAKGGISYSINHQVEPVTKSLVRKQLITSNKLKWALVGIIGVFILQNTMIFLFTDRLDSILPLIIQSVILVMILKNNKNLKIFLRIWAGLLIITSIIGLYLSTIIPAESNIPIIYSFLGGLFVFWFSGQYVSDINTSNKAINPKAAMKVMRKKNKIIVIVVFLCAFSLPLFIRMIGGGGVVVHSGNSQPIADARVTLKCMKSLFHGSEEVKTLEIFTDKSGKFSFSTLDLIRCDFAFIYVKKKGYFETRDVDLRYGGLNFDEIPDKIYLTPVNEKRLQKIKYHAAMALGYSTDLYYNYFTKYREFIPAKRIAETENEKNLVKKSFCKILIEANEKLTETDRNKLLKSAGEIYKPERVDHKKYVMPYCKNY